MWRALFLAIGLCHVARAAEKPTPAANMPPVRGLVIAVADNTAPEIKEAAARIAGSAGTVPLLKVFATGNTPRRLDSRALLAAGPAERAFAHLVCVGLPEDPLVQAAWGREARRIEGGFYVFGYGHLRGDIGYIESDRNPFLHSRFIDKAPFETEIVLVSGNTPRGVALAADAFLKGVVNGVVAAPGWTRSANSLLEKDPLAPGFEIPNVVQQKIGDWQLIGVTPGAADEYRGVLADSGIEPRQIWRGKYYKPGVWDGAGAGNAITSYFAGLQRRAYGNTLWAAEFSDEDAAKAAAPKIAAAANLKKDGEAWRGAQPPYGFETASPGPLRLSRQGSWLLLSTIPDVN